MKPPKFLGGASDLASPQGIEKELAVNAISTAGYEGRLISSDMSLETDTRLDHRLKKALDGLGLLGNAAPAEISRLDDHQAVVAAVKAQHEGFGALYEALPNDLVRDPVLGYTTHDVPTEDGHTVAVRVYRGAGAGQKVPCVIYYHGGGMVILDAFAKVHDRWCQDLAATGLVVVAVNYRNGYTEQGLHPFPTGLNDCFAALRWVNSRRESLGISKIMLQGESGGGNLALASALKAMKEGCIDAVDGVYANVPYISGGYSWDEGRKRAELPSLIASNGYFIECSQMDLLVAIYDPAGDNAENPLCWPYFAKERDLTGLPPHVIAVNELDPLRDEGIAFYRKLLAAGVLARARTNHGLVHAADLIFRQAIPDIYLASISDIASFARSL